MSKKTPLSEVVRTESVNLVALQRRLFDAGLIATAAAINEAANKLGWEASRLLDRKAKLESKP